MADVNIERGQRACMLFRGQRTIYEVTREWVTYAWLCAAHARSFGYPLKKIGETDQLCDVCRRDHAAQAS